MKQKTKRELIKNVKKEVKIILIAIVLGIFIFWCINLVNASTLGAYKQNECVKLIQTCGNCSYVNISSVNYPNSTQILGQVKMTKIGTLYNYTFCNTTTIGAYIVNGFGDDDGIITPFNYDFKINAIGFDSSDSLSSATNRGVYFIVGIMILFFVAGFFINHPTWKWTCWLVSMLLFTIGANMIFISLYNEIGDSQLGSVYDKLAASSSLAFWFLFGILIMIWVLTTIASLADRKRMKQAEATGLPTDFGGH